MKSSCFVKLLSVVNQEVIVLSIICKTVKESCRILEILNVYACKTLKESRRILEVLNVCV